MISCHSFKILFGVLIFHQVLYFAYTTQLSFEITTCNESRAATKKHIGIHLKLKNRKYKCASHFVKWLKSNDSILKRGSRHTYNISSTKLCPTKCEDYISGAKILFGGRYNSDSWCLEQMLINMTTSHLTCSYRVELRHQWFPRKGSYVYNVYENIGYTNQLSFEIATCNESQAATKMHIGIHLELKNKKYECASHFTEWLKSNNSSLESGSRHTYNISSTNLCPTKCEGFISGVKMLFGEKNSSDSWCLEKMLIHMITSELACSYRVGLRHQWFPRNESYVYNVYENTQCTNSLTVEMKTCKDRRADSTSRIGIQIELANNKNYLQSYIGQWLKRDHSVLKRGTTYTYGIRNVWLCPTKCKGFFDKAKILISGRNSSGSLCLEEMHFHLKTSMLMCSYRVGLKHKWFTRKGRYVFDVYEKGVCTDNLSVETKTCVTYYGGTRSQIGIELELANFKHERLSNAFRWLKSDDSYLESGSRHTYKIDNLLLCPTKCEGFFDKAIIRLNGSSDSWCLDEMFVYVKTSSLTCLYRIGMYRYEWFPKTGLYVFNIYEKDQCTDRLVIEMKMCNKHKAGTEPNMAIKISPLTLKNMNYNKYVQIQPRHFVMENGSTYIYEMDNLWLCPIKCQGFIPEVQILSFKDSVYCLEEMSLYLKTSNLTCSYRVDLKRKNVEDVAEGRIELFSIKAYANN